VINKGRYALIAVACVIGLVLLFGVSVIFYSVLKFPEYKQQKTDDQNQKVINYFCSLYEEDIEDIEVTGYASLGSGNPVPFAGKDASTTYEYKLLINEQYHATVWVNWDNETFSLHDTDFPGH